MYVCGMTVYDYCHLGHARVMVVFDMVSRWLRVSGFDVTYVRNITDIDDKIIKRAAENNESIGELTQRFIDAMDEDAAKLGVLRPDIEPRATDYIDDMLQMISILIEKGHAYQAQGKDKHGDVFYSVNSFPDYGKLSGKSLADLRAGERVEIDTHKRDAMDFVLWKSAKLGEPSWDSPWGKGRPGWHIECSVMGEHHLGNHFDIHGGGQDLQFPHHENEIAQSEGAHDCKFVNYWMHNGFVRVDEEKMSKSLGNFFTVREVLKKYDAEVVRFFILRAQYRSPLNYSDQHLDDAKQSLSGIYTALRGLQAMDIAIDWQQPAAARFKAAMDDDFNTPEAFAVLFDLARELNIARKEANITKSVEVASQLKALAGLIGLLQGDPVEFSQGLEGSLIFEGALSRKFIPGKESIERLIKERTSAKKAKNFDEADRIRKELAEQGIVLEDSSQGTTWRRA